MADSRDKRKRLNPGLVPKFRPKEAIPLDEAEGRWGDGASGGVEKRRALNIIIAIVGCAAFVGIGCFVLSISTDLPREPVDTTASGPHQFVEAGQLDDGQATEIAAKLLNKLNAYCIAESIEHRMEMVRGIEDVRPQMVRWAKLTGNPPIPLDGIVLSDAQLGVFKSGDSRFFRLTLSRSHQRKWSVFFEESEHGQFHIDWRSMVGCGDLLLADFLERKPKETVQLRVVVRESDYYNFGFTPAEYKAFELIDPDRTHSVVAYASLTDPLVVGLTTLQSGSGSRNVNRKVIIDVRYQASQDLPPRVVVERYVKDGWFLSD